MINKRNVMFLLNIWTYGFFFLDDIFLKKILVDFL